MLQHISKRRNWKKLNVRIIITNTNIILLIRTISLNLYNKYKKYSILSFFFIVRFDSINLNLN